MGLQLLKFLIDDVLGCFKGILVYWMITPQLWESCHEIWIKFIHCPIDPLINKGCLKLSGS